MKELSCDYFCITAGHFKLLFSQFYEFGYSSSITLEVMMEGIGFCGRNAQCVFIWYGAVR